MIGPLRPHPGTVAKPRLAPRLVAAPNPFVDATWIAVRDAGRVEVYDVRGRRLRTLAVDPRAGGAAWDGRDDAGRRVGPGVYLACARGASPGPALKLLRLSSPSPGGR